MQDEEIFTIDKVEEFIKKLLRKGLHINSKEQYHMSIMETSMNCWNILYYIPICIYIYATFYNFSSLIFLPLKRTYKL